MFIYSYCRKKKIPIIADGGMKYSGDIVKALAAGANLVMLGNILAVTNETPGEIIKIDCQNYKAYVGMGSIATMFRGSSDRYFQKKDQKIVPEAIESVVPTKGFVKDIVFQLVGGLRSGLGYMGSKNISTLHQKAQFIKISNAGLVESHPHNAQIFQEAPNYRK